MSDNSTLAAAAAWHELAGFTQKMRDGDLSPWTPEQALQLVLAEITRLDAEVTR